MFYSHEILTNGQYGVATIWLVATLGGHTNLKRVPRRAILDVDLLKACKTITEPDLPMALRLQGSLLIGMTRVFSRQAGYVLTDLTALRDHMRSTRHDIKEMDLDLDAMKARSHHLNLAEDPLFVPDMDLNFDLTDFGFSSESGGPSIPSVSVLSSQHSFSSQSSIPARSAEEKPDSEAVNSVSPREGVELEVDTNAGTRDMGLADDPRRRPDSMVDIEPTIIEDPVFEVDEAGFLQLSMFSDEGDIATGEPAVQPRPCETGLAETAVHGSEALDPIDESMQLDIQADEAIPMTNDNIDEALAVLTADNEPDEHRSNMPMSSPVPQSVLVEAPLRRARIAKALLPDQRTELSNHDLSGWNSNYLSNMAAAASSKQTHLDRLHAKKNAQFWLLLQGIGGVSSTFGEDLIPHPLSFFSGQTLWDLLTETASGRKRSRSKSMESDSGESADQRLRKRRTISEDLDREGIFDVMIDRGIGFPPQGEDVEIESEVGRHEDASLADQSSAMPWNMSGSRHSSVRPFGSAQIPRQDSSLVNSDMDVFRSSVGAPSRQMALFTGASPLLARGTPSSRFGGRGSLDAPSPLMSDDNNFANLESELRGDQLDEDFELFGPSANDDSQPAEHMQWVEDALENEAYNFLAFVRTKIKEQMDEMQRDEVERAQPDLTATNITLDKLLPPNRNSPVVGAQALLHILSLVTKGLLDVHQEHPFGEIEIAVSSS